MAKGDTARDSRELVSQCLPAAAAAVLLNSVTASCSAADWICPNCTCTPHTHTRTQPCTARTTCKILDIAPFCSESLPQKCSGMARVLKGSHSFTCTPTRSSAVGMSNTYLCLPSYGWYSFTDPKGWKAE